MTVVGTSGDLIGGAIMPGVGLMNDMLAQRTSKLTRVPLEQPGLPWEQIPQAVFVPGC